MKKQVLSQQLGCWAAAALVVMAELWSVPAYAVGCTTPTGTAGDQIYNTTYNIMQYCNGTSWVNMPGNTTIGSLVSGKWCTTDGTVINCTSAQPINTAAGSDKQIQFNNGGTNFGGSANFIWDYTNNRLGIASGTPAVSLDISQKSDAVALPSGSTALRPTVGVVNGMLRYNTDSKLLEAYQNNAWATLTSGNLSVNLGSLATTTNPQRSGEAGTGLFSPLSGQVGIAALGVTSALFNTFSGATDYLSVTPGTSASAVTVGVTGTDTNIPLTLSSAGNGNLTLTPGTSGSVVIPTGSVVIGTTSAGYTLDVRAASNTTVNVMGKSSGVRGGLSADTPVAGTFYSGSYANFPYTLGVNNAEIMRIDTTGFVGLGSTSPRASLDLSQKNDAIILPSGLTSQRPGSGVNGMIRYNTAGNIEGYVNNAWSTLLTSNTALNSGITLGTAGAANPQLTGDKTTGLFAIGTTTVGVEAVGVPIEEWSTLAGGNAYLAVTPGINATTPVTLAASGPANTALTLTTAGSGNITLTPGSSGALIIPNGSVGIGTTNPGTKLDITGTARVLSATQFNGFIVNNGANNVVVLQGGAASNDNGQLGLLNGGTAGAFLTASGVSYINGGNLGIGSTSPVVSLDLSQKTDAVALPSGITSARPVSGVAGMIRYNQSLAQIEAYLGTTWTTIYGYPTGSTGYVQFANGGAFGGDVNFFWDNVNKRLGIGTNLPANALDVKGSVAIGTYGGSAATSNTMIVGGQIGINTTLPNAGAALDLSANTTTFSSLYLPVGTSGTRPTGANGMIRYNTTTSAIEGFVAGNWTSIGATTVGGSANQIIYNNGTSQAGSNNLWWDFTNNRLGLGTNVPNARLSILAPGAYTSPAIQLIQSNATTYGINIGIDNAFDGGMVFSTNNNGTIAPIFDIDRGTPGLVLGSGYVEVYNPPTNGMLIQGSVGIGTSSVANKLDINGSATIGYAGTAAAANGLSVLGNVSLGTSTTTLPLAVNKAGTAESGTWVGVADFRDATPNKGVNIGYDTASQTGVITAMTNAAASNLAFWTYSGAAWGERMRLSAAGNLGIATNSPVNALDVKGGIGLGNYAGVNATSNGYLIMSGSLGVGTTSPTEAETIAAVSTYNTGLKITGASLTGSGMALESTAVGGHKFDLFTTGSSNSGGAGIFAISDETAGGNYRLTINSVGSAGLGTNSPTVAFDLSQKSDAVLLPSGATTARPTITTNGMIRYNTNNSVLEAYVGSVWKSLVTTNGNTDTYVLGTAKTTTNPQVSGDPTTGFYGSAGTVAVAASGVEVAQWNTFTGGTDYLSITAGTASTPVTVAAAGSDPNIGLTFSSTGTGNISILPGTSGSVGIGTASPIFHLDNYQPTSAARTAVFRRGTQGSDASMVSAYGVPYLSIGDLEFKSGSIQTIGFGYNVPGTSVQPAEIGFTTTSTTGYTQGDIVFANRNGTGATLPTEIVRMTSTGNVGIATSAPQNKLDVNGAVAVGTYAGVNTATSGNIIVSGSIGIATTSPAATLQVGPSVGSATQYNVLVDSDTTSIGYAQYVGNWVSTGRWGIGPATGSADNNVRIGNVSNQTGTWSGTQNVNLLLGGNLALGTTSAAYQLDMRGYGNASQLHLGPTSADSGAYMMGYSTSAFYLGGGVSYNGTNWVAKSTTASLLDIDSGAFYFYGNTGLTAGNTYTPTLYMTISNTGHVGINMTPNATEYLAVSGPMSLASNGGGSTNKLYFASGDTGHYIYSTGTGGNNMYLGEYMYLGGAMHFYDTYNSVDRMMINASGVGIGTTATNSLDVKGGEAVGTYAGVNTAGTGNIIVSGSVGIGTTGPSLPFHVAAQSFMSNVLSGTAKNQLTFNAVGTNYAQFYSDGVSGNNSLSLGGSSALTTVPATPIMVWGLSSGSVAIGTATMSSKYNIYGNASIGTTYVSTGAPANGAIIQGSVGIGTSAPANNLQIESTASTVVQERSYGTATPGYFSVGMARGTQAAPTAILAGDQIGQYNGFGYDGSTWAPGGNIVFFADQTWTTSAHGTYTAFFNRVDNTITSNEDMRITNAGSVAIGTTASYTNLVVQGPSGTWSNTESSTTNTFQLQTGSATGDQTVIFGNDKTNHQTYIQSINWGTGIDGLLINPRGGSVGIGTSQPDSALHVNGEVQVGASANSCPVSASNAGAIRYVSGSGSLNYCNGVTGAWTALSGSASASAQGATNSVQFNNGAGAFGGAINMIWDNTNSRLGIGSSTAPVYALDLLNKTDAIRLPIGTSGQRPTATAGLVRYNQTTSAVEFYNGTTWASLGAGAATPAAGSTNQIQFSSNTNTFTANANFVWDNTNFRLGVNTATPLYAADIYGSTAGTSALEVVNTNAAATNIIQGLAPNMTTGTDVYLAIGQGAATNNWGNLGFYYAGSGSTSNRLDFQFYGGTPLMTLLASGSHGIGTVAPKNLLDVTGGMALGSYAGVNATTTGNLIMSGSIGVATTSPGYPLDIGNTTAGATTAQFGQKTPIYAVQGDPNIGFNLYYNSGWKYGTGSANSYGATIGVSTSTGAMTFSMTAASGNAAAAATVAGAMAISKTGNVGIGSMSPTVSLDFTGRTDGIYLPSGLTTQRPTVQNGLLRYNSSTNSLEAYVNSTWGNVVTTTQPGSANIIVIGTTNLLTNPQVNADPTSGFFSSAASTVGVSAGGTTVELWNTFASAVDYMSVTPGTAASPVTLAVAGSDPNAALLLSSKGSGNITLTPGTSGFVGIGTTATLALDVYSATPTIRVKGSGTTSEVRLNSSFGGAAVGAVGTADATPFILMAGNTEYMRLTSSGSVGIGTASPANKLDVNGALAVGTYAGTSATSGNIIVSGSVGIGTSAPFIKTDFYNSTSASRVLMLRRGTQGADASMVNTFGTPYLTIGASENRTGSIQTIGFGYNGAAQYYVPAEIGFVTTSVSGYTQGDLVFATRNGITNSSPSENMRITSTGSTGIGTNAPGSKLDVNGNVSVGYPGVAAPGSGMIVAGSVGIGTNSPTGQFHLYNASYGNIWMNGSYPDFSFDGGTDSVFFLNNVGASGGRTSFAYNSTELMSVLNTGSVAIANTTPTTQLDIVAATNNGNDGLVVEALNRTQSLKLGWSTIQASNIMTFATNGANERMRIDTSGNVGIGTASPAQPLTVYGTGGTYGTTMQIVGSANNNQVNITPTMNAWGMLLWADPAAQAVSGYHGPNYAALVNVQNAPLVFGANNTAQAAVTTSGISIGTNVANANGIGKLQLYGTDSNAAGPHVLVNTTTDAYPIFHQLNWTHNNISMNFDAYYNGGWKSGLSTSNFQIYKTSDQLQFNYGSGAAKGAALTWNTGMVMTASGSVGIGQPSPVNKLDIVGNETINTGSFAVGTTTPGASVDFSWNSDALALPSGVTAARPAAPINGMIRYNQSNTSIEAYLANGWYSLFSTASGVASGVGLGSSVAATNPSGFNGAAADLTTGFYNPSVGVVAVSAGGVEAMQWNTQTGSGFSYLSVTPGNTTSAVTLQAAGQTNVGLLLGSAGSSNLQLTPGTSGNIYVSRGNIGMGTTTPSYDLSFGGTVVREIWVERNTNAATAGNNLVLSAGGTKLANTNQNGGNLVLQSGISTGTGASSILFQTSGGGSTGTADKGLATVMTVTGTGNVGIGTSSPLGTLSLYNAVGATDLVLDNSGNSGLGLYRAGTGVAFMVVPSAIGAWSTDAIVNDLVIRTQATTERILFNTNGGTSGSTLAINNTSVGINSASPVATLDVSQGTSIALPSGNTAARPASPVNGMIRYNTDSKVVEAYQNTAWSNIGSVGNQWSNGASWIYYNSGSVGIGTVTAAHPLDLYNTSATTQTLNVVNTGSNSWIATADFTTPNMAITQEQWINVGQALSANNAFALGFYYAGSGSVNNRADFGFNNGATPISMLASGSVGVGTTSPNRTFEINNAANFQMRMGVGASGSAFTYDLGRNGSDGLLHFYANQTGYTGYVFEGIDGERMRVAANGYVGIGTSNPTAPLSLGSALTAQKLALYDGGTPATFYGFGLRSGYMDFQTAGTVQMTINGSGSVGIGTNAPTSTLSLVGNASIGTYTVAAPANSLIVSGSVGIGTSSPGSIVDVQAIDSQATISLTNTSSTAPRYPQFLVTDYTSGNGGTAAFVGQTSMGSAVSPQPVTSGITLVTISGNGKYDTTPGHWGNAGYITISADGSFTSTSAPGFISFNTTPSGSLFPLERLRINSLGSVGIGTTTPLASLDISARSDAIILPSGNTAARPASVVNGMIRFNTDKIAAEVYQNGNWSTLGASATQWLANGTSLYYTSGSVGIGTTAPINSFDVAGNVAIGASYAGVRTAPASSLIVSGSVGIGTYTPRASLDMGYNTDGLILPSGTSGNRPTGTNGMIRFNSSGTGSIEAFVNGGWVSVSSGGGGGSGNLGTAAAASPSIVGNPTSGFYSIGTNVIAVESAGIQVEQWNPATGTGNAYLNVTPGNTTTAVTLAAAGQTNMSLALSAAGSGKVLVSGSGFRLDNGQNIYWRNSGNTSDTSVMTLSGDTTIIRGGGGTPTLQLQTNSGTTALSVVESTGSVTIGTTTAAQATLDVAGTVRIAGTGSESCASTNLGMIRYNPSTQKAEMCISH